MEHENNLHEVEMLIAELGKQLSATLPAIINAPDTFQEIKEILNSIDTKKTFESLTEHRSHIQEKNLSNEELLNYATALRADCELLEYENENLKKHLNVSDKLLSSSEALQDAQKISQDTLSVIRELESVCNSTRHFTEGQLVGRDAQKKNQAKKGAKAKLANDPKQVDKAFVFERWNDWQEKSGNYKSKAAFARDMLDKINHIKSQKKIEDWCRKWEKQNGTLPAE